jgi:hypothetical protein
MDETPFGYKNPNILGTGPHRQSVGPYLAALALIPETGCATGLSKAALSHFVTN